MQQNVINLPTAKTINYRQNKPFRVIQTLFNQHKNKINENRMLINALIVSNFISWVFLLGAIGSIVTHTHDIDLPQVQQQQLQQLPPIEEVK